MLELAKKRKKIQEDVNRDDSYHMPEAYDKDGAVKQGDRYKVLTQRYRCSGQADCMPWQNVL